MNENKVIIYTANDGKTRIDVKLEEESLWLTQTQMCELYQTSKSNVSEHIKHIFEEGELAKEATVRKFRIVQLEGSRCVEREVEHYNLDMIIALGYRVRTIIATRFRQWATERLKAYIYLLILRLRMCYKRYQIPKNMANHSGAIKIRLFCPYILLY